MPKRQMPGVLTYYGIKLTPRPTKYEARCPAHNSDRLTLSIHRIGGEWECYCMECGFHEDTAGFVAWAEGCTKDQAAILIASIKGRHSAPVRPKQFVTGRKCGAKTRKGIPCIAPSLANGRCRNHGGLSTGPKTSTGKAKAKLNLIYMQQNSITHSATHQNQPGAP